MGILRTPEHIVAALAKSPFRRKFRLSAMERSFLREHGLVEVLRDARTFVTERLASADPVDEGKQTPFRGHPVFVAQHATATCCRRCLDKWHRIPSGRCLSAEEEGYVVGVISCWLRTQTRTQPVAGESAAAAA